MAPFDVEEILNLSFVFCSDISSRQLCSMLERLFLEAHGNTKVSVDSHFLIQILQFFLFILKSKRIFNSLSFYLCCSRTCGTTTNQLWSGWRKSWVRLNTLLLTKMSSGSAGTGFYDRSRREYFGTLLSAYKAEQNGLYHSERKQPLSWCLWFIDGDFWDRTYEPIV